MAAPSHKAVVSITNVEPTILLMNKYGREFSGMVRTDVTEKVTPFVARVISAKAASSIRQGPAVAGTFKPVRDRLPAVRGFGATRVASTRVQAGHIGFGANWGGGARPRTRQFGPWTGGGVNDRFIYSSIDANKAEIDELWQQALDRCYKAWNRG